MLWSILVGINHYPRDKPLWGAVRDVDECMAYLHDTFGPENTNIVRLTATVPADKTSLLPCEPRDKWPTWDNVDRALETIKAEAKKGDSVYVHYSGHGVSSRPITSQMEMEDFLSLALYNSNLERVSAEGGIPPDAPKQPPSHELLYGSTLRDRLKELGEMDLPVTLVLDCCFSGHVVRSDLDVRCIEYNPLAPVVGTPGATSSSRNGTLQAKGLLEPDRYTILAACDRLQNAWEVEINGDHRRGCFSYYLFTALGALSKGGILTSQEALFDHITARMLRSERPQTPTHFGNGVNTLAKKWISPHPLGGGHIGIYRRGDQLRLAAGQIHGILKGQKFHVHAYDAAREAEPLTSVEVQSVGLRSATLTALANARRSVKATIEDHQHLRAVPQFAELSRPGITRLFIHDNATPHVSLPRLREAMPTLRVLAAPEEAPDIVSELGLSVNSKLEFEIRDAREASFGTQPTIPIRQEHALLAVGLTIQQMADFNYYEAIQNTDPATDLTGDFTVLVNGKEDIGDIHTVEHEGSWNLSVKNKSDFPLHLAIFDFAPTWALQNASLLESGPELLPIDRQNRGTDSTLSVNLEAWVPSKFLEQGKRECVDKYKLILMRHSTSFPMMKLPDIVRYTELGGTELEDEPGWRLGPPDERAQDIPEAWATHTITIRTVCDPKKHPIID